MIPSPPSKAAENGMTAHQARDRPGRFYRIVPQADGSADVYLYAIFPETTDGNRAFRVVRGVNPQDALFGGDLEGHVRAHYSAWAEAGETIEI